MIILYLVSSFHVLMTSNQNLLRSFIISKAGAAVSSDTFLLLTNEKRQGQNRVLCLAKIYRGYQLPYLA